MTALQGYACPFHLAKYTDAIDSTNPPPVTDLTQKERGWGGGGGGEAGEEAVAGGRTFGLVGSLLVCI